MDKATAPLDLLRELRQVFEHDAAEYRKREQIAPGPLEQQACAAKAYANETVVRKIDATLRDWA
jgi:hypothetical protein